jgi:hypothetical protein
MVMTQLNFQGIESGKITGPKNGLLKDRREEEVP